MTRSDLTDLTIVLDRSGSMAVCATEMEDAIREFLKSQVGVPGEMVVSLVRFDHEYEVAWTARKLKETPPVNLHPRGNTALVDALYRAVWETGSRLAATPEAQRPGKVIFVVVTDGNENASREHTKKELQDLVEWQTKQYSWTFMYFGANVDAFSEAGSVGIAAQHTHSFDTSAAGVQMLAVNMTRSVTEARTS